MNTQASDKTANDGGFCLEQVQSVNPLFRITSLFADRSVAERLLPLYALFASIEQICSSISDESVAARKLEWWRGALSGGDSASAEHPIIAELSRTGALEQLPRETLTRLLDMAAYRIEAPATPGKEELVRLCQMTGHPGLQLELALSGNSRPPVPTALAVRRGLAQLVREDLGRERHSWWVPLDLMAKHGVRREDIPQESMSVAVKELFTDLLREPGIQEYEKVDEKIDISEFNQSDRHVFVVDALSRRKLEHTKINSYDKREDIWSRPRAGDLFCCWKAARQFSRRK